MQKFEVEDKTLLENFIDEKSGLLSAYNNKMKALIAEYKEKPTDSKTSYIFLLEDNGVSSKNKDKRDAAGFMPRGKQFGFVFTNGVPLSELNVTIAHELGHGRWRLTHTFDDYGDRMKKSTTDNLMDYANGTHLAKWQWEYINDPAWFTNPFEGDEAGMYPTYSDGGRGITPSNMVITDLPEKYNDFEIVSVHNTFKSNLDFAVQGWDLYNKDGVLTHRFNWNSSVQKYIKFDSGTGTFDNSVVFDVKLAEEGNANLFMIKENDACYLYYRHISWKKGNTLSTVNLEEINLFDGWIRQLQRNHDNTCVSSFISNLKDTYNCTLTSKEIDEKVLHFKAYAKSIDGISQSTLSDVINAACLEVLKRLSYDEKMTLFNKLIAGKIEDVAETATLKVMSSLYSYEYKGFLDELSLKDNEKLRHLISEMDDSYVLFWTGDNYTNFMGALVYIYNNVPEVYENRLQNEDVISLLGKSMSVYSSPFKSEIDIKSRIPLIISLSKSRIAGFYDNKTGKVEVRREEYVIPVSYGTAPTFPTWTPTSTLGNVDPLDPIIIMAEKELPLVQTALDLSGQPAGDIYVIPAIFLEYKKDLEFTDQSITAGMLALDIITIASSGGTALAAKVPTLRRLWAIGEVAGAIGSIGINTGVITTQDTALHNAVNTFNLAMGVIGIKNLSVGTYKAGKGIVNAVKELPQTTLDLINKNQSLRDVFRNSYVGWKMSLMRVKNLDELTPDELALLTKQDETYHILGVADKAADGSHITWEQAIRGGSQGIKHIDANDFINLKPVQGNLISDGMSFTRVPNLVNEGKALIVAPQKGTALATKVDDYVAAFTAKNTQLQGNLGEEIAELLAKELDNSTVLNLKINNSGHGFDVMQFENAINNPTVIRIIESKPMTDGRIVLPRTMDNGIQMSKQWRDAKIAEMIDAPDLNMKRIGEILNKNGTKIEPYILTIDKDLKQVVIIKLDM